MGERVVGASTAELYRVVVEDSMERLQRSGTLTRRMRVALMRAWERRLNDLTLDVGGASRCADDDAGDGTAASRLVVAERAQPSSFGSPAQGQDGSRHEAPASTSALHAATQEEPPRSGGNSDSDSDYEVHTRRRRQELRRNSTAAPMQEEVDADVLHALDRPQWSWSHLPAADLASGFIVKSKRSSNGAWELHLKALIVRIEAAETLLPDCTARLTLNLT